MKLYLFLFAVVLLTACQKPKNWTCTCDYDISSYGKGTTTFDIQNAKQADASAECSSDDFLNGRSGTATCSLKVKK
jgi:hypothetical protein